MFTGIIRHVGEILATHPTEAGRRLTIDLGPLVERVGFGDSVSVSGACLTASTVHRGRGEFDVVSETLSRTKLGRLGVGSRVNLEPSLTLQDGLEGHLVQGHVDGLATVATIERDGRWVIRFHAGGELTGQMVPKGSVAIDGVSLTLTEVAADGFAVALIPTTLAETTLANLSPGDVVNIEVDLIGKYVRRFLEAMGSAGPSGPRGLTMDQLRRAGFV